MRIFRLLMPVALLGAALLSGSLPGAHAQSGPTHNTVGTWSATTGVIHHTNLPSQGFPDVATHYLYIDTGNCPNSIDVYSVTGKVPTLLQSFAVPASCQREEFIGANALGYSAPCLVFAGYSSNIFSFKVDQSTHQISAQVSQITDPFGATPTDVQITGGKAIVTSDGGGIESYSIAADCTLTEISAIAEPNTNMPSSTVVAGRGVVSPDITSGLIYAFKLASDGALSFANTTPSQFSQPDSIASSGAAVETGSLNTPAIVQAGTINTSGAITFDPTSPQTDPSGSFDASSWYEPVFKHWVVGEQFSGSLGFFSKTPFAYVSTVHTPDNGFPTPFQQTGQFLTFLEVATIVVDYCQVTSTGCGPITVGLNRIQNGLNLGGYVLL